MPDAHIIVSLTVAHRMIGWVSAHRPPGDWEPGFLSTFLEAADRACTDPVYGRRAPGVVDVPLPATVTGVAEGDQDTPGTMTDVQAAMLSAAFKAAGINSAADRLNIARSRLDAPDLESSGQLSFSQCAELIGKLGILAAEGTDHA